MDRHDRDATVDEPSNHFLHITPTEVWRRQEHLPTYAPESYEAEGFIHLTIGEAELIEVANRYYRDDPRDQAVVQIDPKKLTAPFRIDDPRGVYPHLFGTLNRTAVVAVYPMRRRGDGSFDAIEDTH